MDYFVFPKNAGLHELPAFAVGRPAWDNWLVYQAPRRRIPVIDATQATTVFHQNHGYAHVPDLSGDKWGGPEPDSNRRLAGNPVEGALASTTQRTC